MVAKSITVKNIAKTFGWPILVLWIAFERMDYGIFFVLGCLAFLGISFLVETLMVAGFIVGLYLIGLLLITAIRLDRGGSIFSSLLFILGTAITALIIRVLFVLVH